MLHFRFGLLTRPHYFERFFLEKEAKYIIEIRPNQQTEQ
jgi:hypothetical protein